MKSNKIFLLVVIVLASVFTTSCSDDDKYTPGQETGTNNVYFKNEDNLTLNLSDKSFEITIARSNKNGELTVPLKHVRVPECFKVPESVTFANGDTVKTITVTISDSMKVFVNYILDLQIPEEYTNQYKTQSVYPAVNMTVHKEDYKPYARVSYTFGLFGETEEKVLDYSAYLNVYRFKDLLVSGYNFYFTWDQKKDSTQVFNVTDDKGQALTSAFKTGYVDEQYGMISATWDNSQFTGYSAVDDDFEIPYNWTVSLGSLADVYDKFKIISLY